MNSRALLATTDGARLNYQDVYAAGPPRNPMEETYQPKIGRGEFGGEAYVLSFESGNVNRERVFLMKQDEPDRAYRLIPGKPSKLLDHHLDGWGEIRFCVVLPRITSDTEAVDNCLFSFQEPHPDEAELVAIKKLKKSVVKNYLDRGGHEDPYKEISRIQELGDNIHVLKCIEALEDDEWLFIVTPYCSDGTLVDSFPFGEGLHEEEALAYFRNILEILLYLEKHGICHHDLSPDNFLFFDKRLVLFDFAMSIKIPREDDGLRRFLIKPQGQFGTMATQAPELFFNRTPFDGVTVDLWSAAVTLYLLLTGRVLYRLPHPSDILFRFYILAGGLQPGLNEQMVEIMDAAFHGQNLQDQENLIQIAIANSNIPFGALEVLTHLLTFNPANRWNLRDTIESAWVQSGR